MAPRPAKPSSPNSSELHKLLSKEILSLCLNGQAPRIVEELEVITLQIAEEYQEIFEAIKSLVESQKKVTPASVAGVANGNAKVLVELYKLEKRDIADVYSDIVEEAERERLRRAFRVALEQLDTVPASVVKERAIEEVAKELGGGEQKTISDIMRGVKTGEEAEINVSPVKIPFFDMVTKGGLRSSRLIAIAANEKSRKTTLARWLIINASRKFSGHYTEEGVPVWESENTATLFIALENDKEISTFDILAFLMSEYLLYVGKIGKKIRDKKGNEIKLSFLCDAEYLEGFVKEEKLRDEEIDYERVDSEYYIDRDYHKAYLYAMRTIDLMNITIVDLSDGLEDIDQIENHVNRFKNRNKNKRRIIVVDYMQLVKTRGGTLYEDMRLASSWAMKIAMKSRSVVIAISQNNREFQKSQQKGEAGNSVGIAGGTDLQNAVHHLWAINYNQAIPGQIVINQLRSRRSKEVSATFEIVPETGYPMKENGKDIMQ